MARGKYQEWLTDDALLRIESWASDKLTNEQIAENMGIAPRTLNTWINKHEQINQALKKGREPVVRHLENKLMQRALGYSYEEETVEMWMDEQGKKKQKKIVHKRHMPADSSLGMFFLKNYKPNKYRNYNELTKRQIEAEIKKLEAEAKRAELEIEVNESQEDKLSSYISMLKEAIKDE